MFKLFGKSKSNEVAVSARLAAAIFLLLFCVAANSAPIMVSDMDFRTRAYGATESGLGVISLVDSILPDQEISVSHGDSSATTTFAWKNDSLGTQLKYNFEQTVASSAGSISGLTENNLVFHSTTDVEFRITGANDLHTDSYVRFYFELLDLVTSDIIYSTYHENRYSSTDHIGLGGLDAETNSVTGASTGVLAAGHDYKIRFSSRLQQLDGDGSKRGFGSGFLLVEFGDTSALSLPESGSLPFLVIGLAIIARFRRRQ